MHFSIDKFGYLAQVASELGRLHLMLGFTGDPLSGAEYHQRFNAVPGMAWAVLQRRMEWLSFEQALSLLSNASPDLHHQTQDEWLESFVQEGAAEYLSDIAIRQSLGNRYLKRGRFGMIPGIYYVQLLFRFLDRHVMQAYHSLPIQYLNGQRAHCYAGFHRFRAFADYQACGCPISLRRQAARPFPIQAGRWLASRWSAWRSGRYRQPWTPLQVKAYEEAVTSPLFKAD